MIPFLLAPGNKPFAVALVLMLFISILEGVTTILGFAASHFLNSLIPDLDMDLDAHMDLDGSEHGSKMALSKMLSWLRIGEVPVLILFIIFLAAFGLIGITLQSFFHNSFGFFIPVWIASIASVLASIPVVRFCGGILGRYMPGDETYAVSSDTFIGRVATITLGTARPGSPAEAKLRDIHGQTHYIMVEPDEEEEAFDQNTPVLIVGRNGSIFRGTRNMSDALTDDGET